MSDSPRIALLTKDDAPVAFFDNGVPEAMHYYDDTLHTYLQGSQYTLQLKTLASHDDAQRIAEGCHLSFRYKGKDYYLTIVTVTRDEWEVEIEAYGLSLELTGEEVEAYKSDSPKSFVSYLQSFGWESGSVTIGVNEVSDKSITHEWTGTDTVLKRLFSLATVFDAELEFVTHLNQDYTLKDITLNIYRKHSDTVQGIGHDRRGTILRYGKEIEGISRKADITELYTALRPTGNDGLTIASLAREVKDSAGNIEYQTVAGNVDLWAPAARDRFPSNVGTGNKYLLKAWSYSTDNVEVLYGQALAELKKLSEPKVSYEVSGFVDGEIGDTYTIEDDQFRPTLYLEARIVEQELSLTEPWTSKTTFDNFTEVSSELSSSILSQVQELVEKYKTYQAVISSTAGTTFVNGIGTTTLTAIVRDGVSDVTDKFTITWYKNSTQAGTGKTITVASTDFEDVAVYGFKATDADGKVRAEYELTCANVVDGESDYLHLKYSDDGGQTFTANDGTTPGAWLGQYHSPSPVDSPNPSDYTWVKIKGEDGTPGADAAPPQSLEDMSMQYYLSTSDTSQTGGTWSSTMPSFDVTKHLWTRWKAVYINPNHTAYTTPVLDPTWQGTISAIDTANDAAQSASDAVTAANNAVSQANDALTAAQGVADELDPLKTSINEAKAAAQEAKDDVAEKTQQILTDISGTYATKSEVTDIEGDLQTQITANANGLATKVSNTEYQKNKADVDSQLSTLSGDLATAQSTLSDLQSDQSEAAQKLAAAEKTLQEAQDAVDALQTSQSATQSQLEAAQSALKDAQDAVTKAQADVDAANAAIADVQGDIGTIQTDIDGLKSRVTTAETAITQNADEIKLKATRTEVDSTIQQLQSDMSSQIQVNADGISQLTEQTTNLTSEVGDLRQTLGSQIQQNADSIELALTQIIQNTDDTNATFEEWRKYMRFTADGLELGETGNAVLLRLDNDRISFVQEGHEVAYISDQQLYITDATFVHTLRIGNFAFVPRQNGSLDFKQVR